MLKSEEQTRLRDELARERTILANERTFLAYIRTTLALLLVGLSLVLIPEDVTVHVLGGFFMLSGTVMMGIGLFRFLTVRSRIRQRGIPGAGGAAETVSAGRPGSGPEVGKD